MNTPEHIPENLFSALPRPDQVALEHSLKLSDRIREEIVRNGHISFSRYMYMALYEPGLGYYSAGAIKFGKSGDFVTAPELSSLFTKCLARQCEQILREINNPVILEAGAGSGVMMCDLLRALEEKNSLPESYLVLEPGADLRERQQRLVHEKIPYIEDRIKWLDKLPDTAFDGIIIGNEVLDAMPVIRLVVEKGNFRELCVTLDKDELTWIEYPFENTVQGRIAALLDEYINELPDGYRTEINLQINPWLLSVTHNLNQGCVLLIDYGYPRREYFHPQRTDGSLLCHYRHHVHNNPFIYPGLQDITASVDFTTVAEAATAAGLQIRGYTTQAHFLIDCGLEDVMNENSLTSSIDRAELGQQARLLTMPGEMGERFKVIALAKNLDIPLLGFVNFDQRHRL